MKYFNQLTVNEKINVKGNLIALNQNITNIRTTFWGMPELTGCLLTKRHEKKYFDHSRYLSE